MGTPPRPQALWRSKSRHLVGVSLRPTNHARVTLLHEAIGSGKINPGKVFDLTLALDQVAEGYRAMDERRAIKALLLP